MARQPKDKVPEKAQAETSAGWVEAAGPPPEEAPEAPVPAVTAARRRVNRGSTRRINRALEAVQKSLNEFAKEMDLQAFLIDDDGNRIGSLPWVEAMRNLANQDLPVMVRDAIAAPAAE